MAHVSPPCRSLVPEEIRTVEVLVDYQEAHDRLGKPRNKNSKMIGHKLALFRDGWTPSGPNTAKSNIVLRYSGFDVFEP
jgi:hypothetical protein